MSNIRAVPEELSVGRGDPAYMAHAYLTKVPVPAIVPFIEAYCPPGGLVVDPFAGSGMTGVAAAVTGRKAALFDISVLGRHIGSNYVRLVDPHRLTCSAEAIVNAARQALRDAYGLPCSKCGNQAELAKAVWSFDYACRSCGKPVNYYEAYKVVGFGKKSDMRCPYCAAAFKSGGRRLGETHVLDYVDCPCQRTQVEQAPTSIPDFDLSTMPFPEVEIPDDREMYKASALRTNGMTTVASFYAPRNLAVLTELHAQIKAIDDRELSEKLLFAFTAILTRASKRYQWHPKRPLNAANANYYVAPVFYEWNVYDLFLRKVQAVLKSDDYIRRSRFAAGVFEDDLRVTYTTSSADSLPLPDASVDYVFTDPPFGANLFYADMALFQEAWLHGGFSDVTVEAVIDRSRNTKRSSGRYEHLLTAALSECRRILKPDGSVSMVFGNASGAVWALVQRAIANAGLAIDADQLVVLSKGQRSVKGLASGFEDVATLDLIITMRPCDAPATAFRAVDQPTVEAVLRDLLAGDPKSPSHVYLALLRHGMREGWSLDRLHLKGVTEHLEAEGWSVDEKTGVLTAPHTAADRGPTPVVDEEFDCKPDPRLFAVG